MANNIWYTTAPKAYDYGYVKTLKVVGKNRNGDKIRQIQIDTTDMSPKDAEYRINYQLGRYGSGMYVSSQDYEDVKIWKELR